MRSLKTAVFPVFPDRYQFSGEECHHINGGFLCGQAEESPAYMGSYAEIHLVCMLPFSFLDYGVVYHCLCQVIGYETSPDFLHDKSWFVCMEIAQSDGIFQLSEGRFYTPPGKIKLFEALGRELISGQVCDKTFITVVCEFKSDHAE